MKLNTIDLRPIDEDDDHMTMETFLANVRCGAFIDYDGFGELATATEVSSITVSPSEAKPLDWKPPEWATHVVWYNR